MSGAVSPFPVPSLASRRFSPSPSPHPRSSGQVPAPCPGLAVWPAGASVCGPPKAIRGFSGSTPLGGLGSGSRCASGWWGRGSPQSTAIHPGAAGGGLGMTVAPDGRTLAWLCGRLTGLDRRAAVTETLGTSSLLLECLCSLPLVGPTGRAGGPCPFCLSVSCLVPYAPSGICCCSGILEPDTGRNGSLQVSVDTPVHMDRKRGS